MKLVSFEEFFLFVNTINKKVRVCVFTFKQFKIKNK